MGVRVQSAFPEGVCRGDLMVRVGGLRTIAGVDSTKTKGCTKLVTKTLPTEPRLTPGSDKLPERHMFPICLPPL
ncbi:hypothetical protein PGT21_003230 [Puccinia graminis f. sp. tritici]|uniref:Uncharacterized protein n=1 Tax=Puccinia graminis f. sp. tritici TaxID=56615 RepID=A0A5B0NWJ4_PUCGR|nr:hypothetical protein PGT21_003230 [Puccinia graminis f. sp. tritici]KAA1105144.1 hypothetical protein PGTUg99_017580 [Puccinia graminis f. sp. tritici]